VASTLAADPLASSRSRPAETILLVEDDPDIAEMYRFKLECDGYRVRLAMTGETALKLAFQSGADLVLLDMGLPAMDGVQVLTALRADRRTLSLPVVILSNYDDPGLIQRGLQLGAIDYLIKSQITPARVSGGIARWMAAQGCLLASAFTPEEREVPKPGSVATSASDREGHTGGCPGAIPTTSAGTGSIPGCAG
jgi:CheY-like chemotaxis protein